jgi:hypothetical protein
MTPQEWAEQYLAEPEILKRAAIWRKACDDLDAHKGIYESDAYGQFFRLVEKGRGKS